MNKQDFENQLNNLSFDDINPDGFLFDLTVKCIKRKQKRKNIIIITGLLMLTTLFIMGCYFILQHVNIEKQLLYIAITSLYLSYTMFIIFMFYTFKLLPYLKKSFN